MSTNESQYTVEDRDASVYDNTNAESSKTGQKKTASRPFSELTEKEQKRRLNKRESEARRTRNRDSKIHELEARYAAALTTSSELNAEQQYLLAELSKANAENQLRKEQLPHGKDAPWDYDDDRYDWDLAISGTDEAAATATEGH
ncbi:hypothetical protein B9479_006191 [Cryptococcus floricola]|uniref:Uncharacterized protein n=1 Tax=Cryptococcus floricola TaxID=2591691 RepID=A0A5D3ASM9_9TREE|nr:hypothetical protein B9479_006191 [Cryptococcus floricola]